MKADTEPFSPLSFDKLDRIHEGIYLIWLNHVCVYVGMVHKQPMRKRLYQHYINSHNKNLYYYIEAYSSKELRFCYYDCVSKFSHPGSKSKLERLERFFINKFHPRCNLK